MSGTRRKSSIWSFFSLDEDSKYALCDDCKQKVSRGGATTKMFNTSNLVSHLKNNHPELYKTFESQKAQESQEPTASTSTKAKQLTCSRVGYQRSSSPASPQAYRRNDSDRYSTFLHCGKRGIHQASKHT